MLYILGLTAALSVELGLFGVRVNALVPGYIETQMTEREYLLHPVFRPIFPYDARNVSLNP